MGECKLFIIPYQGIFGSREEEQLSK